MDDQPKPCKTCVYPQKRFQVDGLPLHPPWSTSLTSCLQCSRPSSTPHWRHVMCQPASESPPSSPSPSLKSQWPQDCRPVALTCGHEVFWKPCALPCQILNLKLGNMSLNPRPSAPDPPKAAFFLPVHQQLHQFVKLLNFMDDSMLIGPISGGNESAYRWEIDHPVTWCN